MKATKPSEMGLHSKVRYVINIKGGHRKDQENEIIQFAEGLYDFIFDYIDSERRPHLEITQKLARFVSKTFTFPGLEDDEIYSILLKEADQKRKPKAKG